MYCTQLLAAAGGGRPLLLSLLGLFSEGAWPSAQHIVGAACRMESAWSPLLPGSGTQRMRIVLEDLRHQRGPPAAAEHAAASQQHLLGPGFLVGALQAFADRGMLGVRSVRVLDAVSGDEAIANVQQQTSKTATRVAADCGAVANRQQGAMLRQNSRRKDLTLEVEVEVQAPVFSGIAWQQQQQQEAMAGHRFSLPREHFRSLFPFHILLDSDGMLVQVSVIPHSVLPICWAKISYLWVIVAAAHLYNPFLPLMHQLGDSLQHAFKYIPDIKACHVSQLFKVGIPNVLW